MHNKCSWCLWRRIYSHATFTYPPATSFISTQRRLVFFLQGSADSLPQLVSPSMITRNVSGVMYCDQVANLFPHGVRLLGPYLYLYLSSPCDNSNHWNLRVVLAPFPVSLHTTYLFDPKRECLCYISVSHSDKCVRHVGQSASIDACYRMQKNNLCRCVLFASMLFSKSQWNACALLV